MPNFQDLQQKIFFEAKAVLDELSKISTKDELLSRQELFSELTDRISFLKILEKNQDSFAANLSSEWVGNQDVSIDDHHELFLTTDVDTEDFTYDDEGIEEEVVFTTEINEIEPEFTISDENSKPTQESEVESFKEKIVEAAQEVAYEDRVAQKEKEFLELEAKRRKIVEFSKEDVHPTSPPAHEPSQHEKKFKLAHIKGLKVVQNLFDEDPLEKLQEEENEKDENHHDTGSILKTNIPTDFMEAEKKRPEFRLDLNDKVAFTKLLFKGQDAELAATMARLNSYDNIEDARQYLSELYYAKDWKKADEYAQRLWNLVENKFM